MSNGVYDYQLFHIMQCPFINAKSPLHRTLESTIKSGRLNTIPLYRYNVFWCFISAFADKFIVVDQFVRHVNDQHLFRGKWTNIEAYIRSCTDLKINKWHLQYKRASKCLPMFPWWNRIIIRAPNRLLCGFVKFIVFAVIARYELRYYVAGRSNYWTKCHMATINQSVHLIDSIESKKRKERESTT